MGKKNVRQNGIYLIVEGQGINPKLGARIMADGTEHLFLEYYMGSEYAINEATGKKVRKAFRKREYLPKLYLFGKPSTPIQRKMNKDVLELARRIRDEKQREMAEKETGFEFVKDKTAVNMLKYFDEYAKKYTKKDIKMIRLAIKRFNDFLKDTPEYSSFRRCVRPSHLTKPMMDNFADYLRSRSKGEGALSIWRRFKKIIKFAVEDGTLKSNPTTDIVIKADYSTLQKDVITGEEWERMLSTHVVGQSPETRKAAIFSYYTGLRWCDVSTITFGAIDYQAGTMRVQQSKTAGHSGRSIVTNPISPELLELIGTPKTNNPDTERIFNLPTYWAAVKSLQRWVEHAGINKHITWHCLRHSVATELLRQGTNIKVVADYLGHSSLKFVDKYVRALDEDKQRAAATLPKLTAQKRPDFRKNVPRKKAKPEE